MEPLWNKLDLDRPPTCSWTTNSETFDVTRFMQCISKICDDLQSQDDFNQEAVIISRLIYRLKTKFRHDKGLKNMEKVNRALQNYLHLSLFKEYKNLWGSIVIDDVTTVTLPTRQMLQYALVRTQGFAKLMCRIQDVAFCAGVFFRARVIIGQAWTFSMIAWSAIARIWLLSRHLARKCCTWYNSMYPFLNVTKLVGVEWIPSNYCFPTNLKEWLSEPWINEQTECSLITKTSPTSLMFSLITTQDESAETAEKGTSLSEIELIEPNSTFSNEIERIPDFTHDIGVRISRESFNINLETKKKKPKKPKRIEIKDITTIEDLEIVLTYDSYPGLDKLQWNIIKKKINKKLLRLSQCESTKKRQIRLGKIIQFVQTCIT